MKYGTIIILDFNMSASTHPNHVTESEYGVSLTLHSRVVLILTLETRHHHSQMC